MFICFPFLISKADFDGANAVRIHLPKLAVFYYLCGLYTTIILYFCQNEFCPGSRVPAGNPPLYIAKQPGKAYKLPFYGRGSHLLLEAEVYYRSKEYAGKNR
jgi:hypothetical protein